MNRLLERTASTAGRVDREAGVIRGVKLIGRRSKNNREYTTDALRGAIDLYEGVKVFLDHPRDVGEDRGFKEWAGVVRNVRLRADGLYGDIQLRKHGGSFAEICEAADLFPESFGMSHVADGDSRTIDGREVVESIDQVFSVDIVMEPATTCGLFEAATGREPAVVWLESDKRLLAEIERCVADHKIDVETLAHATGLYRLRLLERIRCGRGTIRRMLDRLETDLYSASSLRESYSEDFWKR